MALDLSATLLAAQSPDLNQRTAAEQQLTAWENDESVVQFAVALATELTSEDKNPNSRQLAGLQLKNLLSAREAALAQQKEARWLERIDPASKAQIKSMCMAALGSPQQQAAHTGAQVVARIGAIEMPHQQWPELLTLLLNNMTNAESSELCKMSTLETLGYMCEELDEDAITQDATNQLLTAIVDGMREDRSDSIRAAAATALLNSLGFTRHNFEHEAERTMIMQMVCNATKSTSVPVRVVAYECIAKIATLYYDKLMQYMQTLFELSLNTIRADEEVVGMMAIEFWSSVCDEEMEILDEIDEDEAPEPGVERRTCAKYIQAALPHLVPVLLQFTLTKQDESADDDTWNIAASGAVCLGLVSNTVEDAIVPPVLEFVQQNLQHPTEWRMREAAIMAFGQILEGPKPETLEGPVAVALPVLLGALSGDAQILVKDTAAWTIARICELHATAVPEPMFNLLVENLIASLDGSPSTAAQTCFAIHNLAAAFELEDESVTTSPLSPFFNLLLQKLLGVTVRSDWNSNNLRGQAYEAVNMLVQTHAPDVRPIVTQMTPHILAQLRSTFEMQLLSNDDKEERDNLQSALCALIQLITRAIQGEIAPYCDDAMTLLLQVFTTSTTAVASEEAFMAIGAIAAVLEKGFDKYMVAVQPCLIQGLRSWNEWQVCQAAVGTAGDICRALEGGVLPYCDAIVLCLLEDLRNPDLNRGVKPNVISCFGDIALAVGGNFDKYVNDTLLIINQAAETDVPDDDEELVEYLNSLRESILEAYTGIVQGLNDGAKAPLIVPCLEPIFLFLSKILRDHTERNLVDASVLQAAIGMLGDLTHALGRDIYSFVARPEVAKLLEEGVSASSSDGMRQIVAWTHERIAEVTKGAR